MILRRVVGSNPEGLIPEGLYDKVDLACEETGPDKAAEWWQLAKALDGGLGEFVIGNAHPENFAKSGKQKSR